MNFAILSAVSQKYQAAPDRVSLEAQEERSRALALSRGWNESAGPYRIPGASRSFYVNLSDAEANIPALSQMLEDAKSKRFDVLVIYSYDRLGDLANMVATALRFYGVQLHSVSQGAEILDPASFDPYASDAESNMRTMAQMVQQYRIAELRRKLRDGLKKRVSNGLHSTRIPYAYTKKRERSAVAEPTDSARHVVAMKDAFLHGKPYREIANSLNQQGIPSPGGGQWDHTAVKGVLVNPFYAGKVYYGLNRIVRDVRLGKRSVVPNPTPLLADGKHTPLYDWDTYQAILAEMARRKSLPSNNRYQFSALLFCSVCGSKLQHGRGVWRCTPHDHITLTDEEALALIPPALQDALRAATPASASPAPKADISAELSTLERQRKKIQVGYEADLYTLAESQKKIKDVDSKINALKDSLNINARKQASRQNFFASLASLRLLLEDLPQWIAQDNPVQVNLLLRRIFSRIVITPERKITAEFIV